MKDIFLDMILVVFPILLYLVFSALDLLTNNKYNERLFDVTMVSSLYLCIGCGNNFLIFSNIPIIISYLKKKNILGIFLSLIVLYYANFMYISFIKYILYFVIYIFFQKNKYSINIYIFLVSLFQIVLVYFELDIYSNLFLLEGFFACLITFGSLSLFNLADKITKTYDTIIKNKRELELKDSLFKLTHEVKNPIAVCKGYLEMMDTSDSEKVFKYLNIVKSEIDRSLNIMNDFTEYNKIKINKEEFDMSMLLESVYNSFSLLTKNKNIKLEYINDYDSIYLNGDYNRIEQVLVNVIKNSIEAIDDTGVIKMSVKCFSDKVSIKVSDTGVGMSESSLANIKEMFYTTKREGTGLGVSLSNEIILLHNGILKYDSVLGKGTTCTITLPL